MVDAGPPESAALLQPPTGAAVAGAEEVQAALQSAMDAWNRGDAEGFLDHISDDGLQSIFETTREEAAQQFADFIGQEQISNARFSDIQVTGDTASAEVHWTFGNALERLRFSLVREAGAWKIDAEERLPVPIPDGVTAVDVEMQEFAFVYDPADITSGNVAFNVTNTGEQPHEIALARIPEGLAVDELLGIEDQDQLTEMGVEFLGGAFFGPGEHGNLVFARALEPGRYVMVCFVPDETDPEHTPHAFKGMVSEFWVPAASSEGMPAATASPDPAALAVQDTIQLAVDSWNAKQVDELLGHFTPTGIQSSFGVTPAEAVEELSTFIGQERISDVVFCDVEVSGDNATAGVKWTSGNVIEKRRFTLVMQDGAWKIDSETPLSVDIPSGTAAVSATLSESSVKVGQEEVTSGNIALAVWNSTGATRDVAVFSVPADLDIQDLFQAEDFATVGASFVGATTVNADAVSNIVFANPLPGGRYVMVSFPADLTDEPADAPPAFAEFQVP
jgi:hypothetical protein